MIFPIDAALRLSPEAMQQQIDLRRAQLSGVKSFAAFPTELVGEVVQLTLALRRLKAPPPAPEPVRRAEREPEPEPRGLVPDGPWSYLLWSHRDRWQEASIRAAGRDGWSGKNIATVFAGGPDATSRADLDIEATSRLIAAAPTMLAALRRLRSCEEELSVYGLRAIDEAIEAATGEGEKHD